MNLKERAKTIKFSLRHLLITDGILLVILVLLCVLIRTPEDVSGLAVENTTYDSAEISWEESQDADGYKVYRSEDGEDFDCLGTTEDTSYVDSELTTGQKYYYSVAAYKGLARNTVNKENVISVEPMLATPKLKVSTKKGEVKLKIEEVEGATGYEIYRDDEKISKQ
jgi:fibronectin type 3 domain-containing protein